MSKTKFANNSCTFENLKNGDVTTNSSIEFYVDVLKEVVSFNKNINRNVSNIYNIFKHSLSIRVRKNDDAEKYDLLCFHTRIDSCRVANGVLNSFFMKSFFEYFSNETANYEFKYN